MNNAIPPPRRRVPRPAMKGELYEDYRLSRLDVDNYNLRMENEEHKATIKRQKVILTIFAIGFATRILVLLCSLVYR